MNRDASTLISWDEMSEALDREPHLPEGGHFEGGSRDLLLGIVIFAAITLLVALVSIGMWTAAGWLMDAA